MSCFFMHKWNRWGDATPEIVVDTGNKDLIYRRRVQSRVCHDCGKIEIREVDRVRVLTEVK